MCNSCLLFFGLHCWLRGTRVQFRIYVVFLRNLRINHRYWPYLSRKIIWILSWSRFLFTLGRNLKHEKNRLASQKCFACSFTLLILWIEKYFAWDSGLSVMHKQATQFGKGRPSVIMKKEGWSPTKCSQLLQSQGATDLWSQ